ncbi:MAG: ATP-binding protein [Lachnospiraceae bacterium]|jgi:predicted AAA+ superfamily ATPase|nr:ATP-binding protein [Lachnospiraceae bacterium]
MYRTIIEQLRVWKKRKNRKPLIIRGARQVGKTWIMKEFGKEEYEDIAYFSLDNDDRLQGIFTGDLNPKRIISELEIYRNKSIEKNKTLIIFDEIQEQPKALTSLKYFSEEEPEYHIVCAGSLLGIALHHGTSFPVGKVDFIDLYPLSYEEFLIATGNKRFANLLKEYNYQTVNTFHSDYIKILKNYYYVGGMPEVVSSFIEEHDYNEVRRIQRSILNEYEQDFSKHAPDAVVPKIRLVWNSLSSQLTKENKKFVYGLIHEGARAKEFEMALLWLSDCGLVHMVHRINKPELPLKGFEDLKAFKLFFVDVGLLSCQLNLDQKVLIDGNKLFTEYKGALTEQYVLQQIVTKENLGIYYWTNNNSTSEIDFILDNGSNVIPLEVKAETNLKAKSLKVFHEKYKINVSIRSSMSNYKKENWLVNLPLWAIMNIEREIEEF